MLVGCVAVVVVVLVDSVIKDGDALSWNNCAADVDGAAAVTWFWAGKLWNGFNLNAFDDIGGGAGWLDTVWICDGGALMLNGVLIDSMFDVFDWLKMVIGSKEAAAWFEWSINIRCGQLSTVGLKFADASGCFGKTLSKSEAPLKNDDSENDAFWLDCGAADGKFGSGAVGNALGFDGIWFDGIGFELFALKPGMGAYNFFLSFNRYKLLEFSADADAGDKLASGRTISGSVGE